jgi:DNA polymerase-3 subunit delta'
MNSNFNKEANIFGHEKIVDYLKKCITNERLAHAYLFFGQAGLGKRTVALHFFKSILCHTSLKKNTGQIPCHKCLPCQEFCRSQYPDFYEISRPTDKKNISIEQIRALRHQLSLKPPLAGYKFVIVNEIESLTTEAANSFLKTLEEPPPKTIIVLIGSNEEAIPKTILSRCQVVRFRYVSLEKIRQYLKDEKHLNSMAAKNIAKLSGGCPGRAIVLAENPDICEKEEEKMGQYMELIKSPLSHRLAGISRLKFAEGLAEELSLILNTWQAVSRDLVLEKLGLSDLMIYGKLKMISKNIMIKNDLRQLHEHLEFSLFVPILLKNNVNPKIILENYMLKI